MIFAAASERDRPGAMAANVAKSAQRSLLIADDDDWLAGNVGGEKTFGGADGALHAIHFPAGLAECSDELPNALGNARLLDFQNRRGGGETRRRGLCGLGLFVDVQVEEVC